MADLLDTENTRTCPTPQPQVTRTQGRHVQRGSADVYVSTSDSEYVTYADIYPLSSLQTSSRHEQSPVYHSKHQTYTQK